MVPVDSAHSLPIASSHVQHHNVCLRRVFLIVRIAGANQQFIARKTAGPVTLFAGLAGWTEVLYGGRNGARKGVERYHDNLPQACNFCSHKPWQPRANVAVHTSYVRVRGNVVGGILGKHNVTGRSAEIRRIQVLHSAVRCGSNDEKIDPGGHDYPLQSAPHHGQPEVNGRENRRQLPTSAQASTSEPDAEWNQQEAQYENGGEGEKDQDADVGMRRPRQEDLIEPEGDRGKRRAGSDHGSRERDRILAQKIDRLRRVSDSFSQIHWKQPPSFVASIRFCDDTLGFAADLFGRLEPRLLLECPD